ncbi:MAG: dihydrodipicolinate synthase family protein, partial [Pseudomonadota bacterium]
GGASALLVFPPAPFTLGQSAEMALAHFRTIADATDLPLIVFQYPLATGQGFTVLGSPTSSDAAAIQLGLDLQLAPQALFSVGYDGLLSGTGASHAIRGGLSWKF